jgi:excinuclease UvrABC ATPase subunit
VIKTADYVRDLGPENGRRVVQDTLEDVAKIAANHRDLCMLSRFADHESTARFR